MANFEKPATEILAEIELEERRREGYRRFVAPIHESIQKDRDEKQKELDTLGAAYARKKQKEREEEEAWKAYQKEQEEAKPEELRNEMKDLLHRSMVRAGVEEEAD